MWVILPKHKASEKVQAALKTKISELTDEIEKEKSGPKKAAPGSFKIPRQGAGQVVFLGPPNAGKSLLLSKLTKATPTVAPYPFTTREPVPGMMDYEDVRVQLIDLPPITADHYEPFVTDVTRGADAALLFLDLADDDGPAATRAVIDRLKLARRVSGQGTEPGHDDPTTYQLPIVAVATKCDDEAADIRQGKWLSPNRSPDARFVISADRGMGCRSYARPPTRCSALCGFTKQQRQAGGRGEPVYLSGQQHSGRVCGLRASGIRGDGQIRTGVGGAGHLTDRPSAGTTS